MFIVPEATLLEIQQALAVAAHGIVTEKGQRAEIGTIDGTRLAMAALVGLQIAVGDVIWPSNRKIVLPTRRALPAPFEEQF